MSLRTLSLAAVAVVAFTLDAQAIVYRSDSSETAAQQLADQPQFSGTGIVALANDSGTGEVIDSHWVLTAKHVVTEDGNITPAANAVTFYYAGGNMVSSAIYSDPNSDLALVYFATALPSTLAIITPNLTGTTSVSSIINPVGQQIWNVGYGEYGAYPGSTLTGNNGARLAGTNIVNSRTTVSGLSGNFLAFSNENTSGTEFESSTAPGDSGGPMFIQNGYQWLVTGEVYGAASGVGYIDTDVATDNFLTTTTGLTFTPRAQATSIFWTSTYLNNSSGGNTIALKTPTDGGGVWDTTRLNFTDKTYTYAWQNGTLAPVTFGVGSGAAGTVTLGSNISISNITFAATGSGSYTIAGSGTYALTLQTTGSVITTNVAATISAPLTGTGGSLVKAGTAALTISGANTYDSGTTINAGTLALTGAGTLGATTGGLVLNNTGSTLDLGGTSQAVGGFTGAAGTVVTNNGAALSTLTVGTGNAGATSATYDYIAGGPNHQYRSFVSATGGANSFAGVLQNGSSALAFAKVGTGTITLAGANTYTGGTTISGGTLALSAGSSIGGAGGALTFNGTGTLDLGTNAQTVATLGFGTNATAFTGTVTDGSLTVTGAAGFTALNPTGTSGTYTLDLSGLTTFTYNQAAQGFTVGGASGGGNTVDLKLSAASNAITASAVQIGGGSSGTLNTAALDLGAVNTINTASLQLGQYRVGSSTLDFQSGLTHATVTLRGTGGGLTPVTTVLVNQDSNGSPTTGSLDLSGGTVDAIVNNFTVGSAATNGSPTTTVTMGAGTVNVNTLTLGYSSNTNASANVTTSTFNQNAGTVLANALTFGTRTGTNGVGTTLDTLAGTYNLGTSATTSLLSAMGIAIGTSTDAAASRQVLNFNNGTIENYDPALGQAGSAGAAGGPITTAADLTIGGITGGGAGGNNTTLTINLASTGTHTFNAEAGRSITVASTALITGAGSLTKAGAGNLTLAGTASHTGATAVSAGALFVNGALTGTSGVTVASGGTLGGGGTITTGSNGGVTVASGGHLAPGVAGAGSVGMLSFALGTGTFDASAATAANNGAFVFDLATTAASDAVRLTSGTFNLGTGTLGLNDFAFTTQTGFGAGTYTLLSSASLISLLSLDLTNLTGTVGGLPATLSDSGTAILLTVSAAVPEPGTWMLVALGAVGLVGFRRRSR